MFFHLHFLQPIQLIVGEFADWFLMNQPIGYPVHIYRHHH